MKDIHITLLLLSASPPEEQSALYNVLVALGRATKAEKSEFGRFMRRLSARDPRVDQALAFRLAHDLTAEGGPPSPG